MVIINKLESSQTPVSPYAFTHLFYNRRKCRLIQPVIMGKKIIVIDNMLESSQTVLR